MTKTKKQKTTIEKFRVIQTWKQALSCPTYVINDKEQGGKSLVLKSHLLFMIYVRMPGINHDFYP